MAKQKLTTDEKFTNVDFNLFEALEAIDRKDYGYYDRLTPEQQRKFSAYMMLMWVPSVKGAYQIPYLQRINQIANKHVFDEVVQDNPKLQWLMLCASSPGKGKQYREYVPSLNIKVVKLQEKAELDSVKKYFSKLHPNVDAELIDELSKLYTRQQHRKVYLAEKFPHLKLDEIELLNELTTDDEIQEYERLSGN
jgi:hypothetical protein